MHTFVVKAKKKKQTVKHTYILIKPLKALEHVKSMHVHNCCVDTKLSTFSVKVITSQVNNEMVEIERH